jgi:hypothetical protein
MITVNRHPAITPDEGDLVDYHGTMSDFHGSAIVHAIHFTPRGIRLRIENEETGAHLLCRPGSVTVISLSVSES